MTGIEERDKLKRAPSRFPESVDTSGALGYASLFLFLTTLDTTASGRGLR